MSLLTTPANQAGLSFSGMKDLGINSGFDLQYHTKDPVATTWLYVGSDDNRLKITGTTPLSRQSAVLLAIDQLGKWAQPVKLWMLAEKNGVSVAKTASVNYTTYVKPFYGKLRISEIARDQPPMTYPGNGKGRLLSRTINGRYYFIYGGKLETDSAMRGFDCTSFPMALLSIPKLTAPGYGKQVCDAVNAAQCGLEQITSADMQKKFLENTIPVGYYILFSAGHVLLYDSYKNILNEFNFGGFKATPAGQRQLIAPQSLWWMRKLADSVRPAFN